MQLLVGRDTLALVESPAQVLNVIEWAHHHDALRQTRLAVLPPREATTRLQLETMAELARDAGMAASWYEPRKSAASMVAVAWELFPRLLAQNNPLKDWTKWMEPESAPLDVSVHQFLKAQGLGDAAIRLAFDVSPYYGTSSYDVSALMYEANEGWGKVVMSRPGAFATPGSFHRFRAPRVVGEHALSPGDGVGGEEADALHLLGQAVWVLPHGGRGLRAEALPDAPSEARADAEQCHRHDRGRRFGRKGEQEETERVERIAGAEQARLTEAPGEHAHVAELSGTPRPRPGRGGGTG